VCGNQRDLPAVWGWGGDLPLGLRHRRSARLEPRGAIPWWI